MSRLSELHPDLPETGEKLRFLLWSIYFLYSF